MGYYSTSLSKYAQSRRLELSHGVLIQRRMNLWYRAIPEVINMNFRHFPRLSAIEN